MRAKKGTRMATATELLLVDLLTSGSATLTFSLALRPARWEDAGFSQRIRNVTNDIRFADTKRLKRMKRGRYVTSAGEDGGNEGGDDGDDGKWKRPSCWLIMVMWRGRRG